MKATEARTTLLAQHEQLRLLLDTCTRLAREQRAGEPVTVELDEVLAELRDEFADHNQMETAVIADLLHGPAAWGSLMVETLTTATTRGRQLDPVNAQYSGHSGGRISTRVSSYV